jgi:small subunit ribosomal protein S8e
MVDVHNIRKRKHTGGKYRNHQPKRLAQLGRKPAHTRIGDRKLRVKRARGGDEKYAVVTDTTVNVIDPETQESFQAEIDDVAENPASRHFARRNIITKGAVLATEQGEVRVTNRPGQEGTINGVLLHDE